MAVWGGQRFAMEAKHPLSHLRSAVIRPRGPFFMSEPNVADLTRVLSQALSILTSHSDRLGELERRAQLVLDGLDLIFDSASYNKYFSTEGQALITYNLLQAARDPEWVPVDRLPRHLVEGRKADTDGTVEL